MKGTIFKSPYGMIKENYLMLYKANSEMININMIAEIKIYKQNTNQGFISYFKKRLYDFTIIMDSQEKITFTFSQKHLTKITAFRTRIWHTKFSLKNSIPEKTEGVTDVLYRF